MRKIVLALAALAAFGLAVPVVSTPAEARDVVIIKKKKMKHHAHAAIAATTTAGKRR